MLYQGMRERRKGVMVESRKEVGWGRGKEVWYDRCKSSTIKLSIIRPNAQQCWYPVMDLSTTALETQKYSFTRSVATVFSFLIRSSKSIHKWSPTTRMYLFPLSVSTNRSRKSISIICSGYPTSIGVSGALLFRAERVLNRQVTSTC